MLDTLYLNLPRPLQNLTMTAYGASLYRQRYGGPVPPPYADIASVFDRPDEKLRRLQAARFAQLVKHTATTVPYYQRLFQDRGIKVQDVTLDNMAEVFPVVFKQHILACPEQFITTDSRYLRGSFSLSTSGSSGTPMRVVSSLEARRINYRYYGMALAEFGLGYRSRSTTFAGRVIIKEGDAHCGRYDYFNNTQYLSSYQISPDSIEHYIAALNRWQPEFIDSYPSVLQEIADLAAARGLVLSFCPRMILTSSETLSDSSRDKISTFFGAPLMDQYGCTEMAVSAYYKDGAYHVHPLYSVMELQPLGGDSYGLLATGLINFAMPLIRYAIGDSVTTDTPANAYCYSAIEGRVDDVVITPEGRRVGRLDPAFKGIEGIALAQVVQRAIDRLEVKVVLAEVSGDAFDESLLLKNFRERTSEKMQIEVSYHQDIERGANGKFKAVVSLL